MCLPQRSTIQEARNGTFILQSTCTAEPTYSFISFQEPTTSTLRYQTEPPWIVSRPPRPNGMNDARVRRHHNAPEQQLQTHQGPSTSPQRSTIPTTATTTLQQTAIPLCTPRALRFSRSNSDSTTYISPTRNPRLSKTALRTGQLRAALRTKRARNTNRTELAKEGDVRATCHYRAVAQNEGQEMAFSALIA